MEIHQLLPSLQYGDAIGNHAIGIRNAFDSPGNLVIKGRPAAMGVELVLEAVGAGERCAHPRAQFR